MEFEKLIAERYSVRSFKEKKVEESLINKILNAGHIAPTGCNFQPQKILVIKSEDALSKLKKCTRCHFDAPLAMLVCYDESEGWSRPYDGEKCAPVDAGIVTTHMMLAAHNLGLGTCWVMHFDPKAMREEFNIPSNITSYALIVIGYASDDSKPRDMHFNTRPIDDVVKYDSF